MSNLDNDRPMFVRAERKPTAWEETACKARNAVRRSLERVETLRAVASIADGLARLDRVEHRKSFRDRFAFNDATSVAAIMAHASIIIGPDPDPNVNGPSAE